MRATAAQIPWALDDGVGTFLPVMQSDIMLTQGNRVLIIDAKYYTHTLQTQYDVRTVHSANLYQIFTYVKNKDAELKETEHEVSGMLLYARTEEEIQPDNEYRMSGNRISVRTLDLNREFGEIEGQLKGVCARIFWKMIWIIQISDMISEAILNMSKLKVLPKRIDILDVNDNSCQFRN